MSATNGGHDKKEATLLRQSSYLIEWEQWRNQRINDFNFTILFGLCRSCVAHFSILSSALAPANDLRLDSFKWMWFLFSLSCRRSRDRCLFLILLFCLLIWFAPGLAVSLSFHHMLLSIASAQSSPPIRFYLRSIDTHTYTHKREMQFRHSFWSCDVLLLRHHRCLWPVKWKYEGKK